MGLRFRKSIKIAPGLKLNINKKSVGLTAGIRGAHYTINSKGKRTKTIGIPGTGLSYTTSTGGEKTKTNTKTLPKVKNINELSSNSQTPPPFDDNGLEPVNNNGRKRKHGCLTYFIAIFIMLGFASCIFGEDELNTATISANTAKVYDINSDVKINVKTDPEDYFLSEDDFVISGGKIEINDQKVTFSSPKEGSYTIYLKADDVKSNKIEIKIEDKKAIAEEKARIKAEQEEAARIQAEQEAQAKAEQAATANAASATSAYAAPKQNTPTADMVWISGTGNKYHRKPDCGRMDPNSATQMTREEAESKGYTPCKRCY